MQASLTLGEAGQQGQSHWRRPISAAAARPKFGELDALRGVAAWAVLTYHMMQDSLPAIVPRGYLAVDFFFALSGFVVSAAYSHRVEQPSGVGRYIQTRLIRLYPLVIIGALLGSAAQFNVYRPAKLLLVLVTGACLIPTPLAPASEEHVAFAANPPSWSLFFEVLVNLAFGLVSRFLGVRALVAIVGLSGLALTLASFAMGSTNGSVYWPTLWMGVPHVCFSFFLGVLLQRLCSGSHLPRLSAPLWLLVLLLVATFSIPHLPGYLDVLEDLLAICLVFPLLITAALGSGGGRLTTLIGELSYPVYILQAGFAQHVKDLPAHLHVSSPAGTFALLLGLQVPYLVFAYVAYVGFDQPVRRWLSIRFSLLPPPPAQTAP